MDGQKLPLNADDFSDPFNAGQMVGMLVILTSIEKNKGIPAKILEEIKTTAADNLQEYFDKPREDILLMIDNIVNGREDEDDRTIIRTE